MNNDIESSKSDIIKKYCQEHELDFHDTSSNTKKLYIITQLQDPSFMDGDGSGEQEVIVLQTDDKQAVIEHLHELLEDFDLSDIMVYEVRLCLKEFL